MKIQIKTVLFEVVKLILIVVVITNLISFFKKPEIAKEQLPNLPITLLDHNQTTLHAFKGKPLILYFWGSWCPICKMSSPVIEKLSKTHQVLTIAVNSGNDQELKNYMQTHNLHFLTINDQKGELAHYFGVSSFPTTFTYNKEGKNIFVDSGYTSSLSLKFKLWLGRFF